MTSSQVEAFMFGSVPLKTYLPDGTLTWQCSRRPGRNCATAGPQILRISLNPRLPRLLHSIASETCRSSMPRSGSCTGFPQGCLAYMMPAWRRSQRIGASTVSEHAALLQTRRTLLSSQSCAGEAAEVLGGQYSSGHQL